MPASAPGSFFRTLTLVAVLTAATVALVWVYGASVRREAPAPVGSPVAAKAGSCVTCHGVPEGLSEAHAPEVVGCAACHAGRPEAPTEAEAHEGLIRVPGNLDRAAETCGRAGCHPGVTARVAQSLMATARGLVAVDRFVFGEQPTPDGLATMADLGDSPADTHLRQLCASCHLAREKTEPGPVTELSRGGGCAACHVRYDLPRTPETHPALTIDVSDDHCFGCHSRSGRISTNYEGLHETLLTHADVPADDPEHRRLADGRVFERRTEDAHHARGLACIDCHTARETMGDGRVYRHEGEQVEITCESCHAAETPETLGWDELDEESRTILRLRYGRDLPERRFLKAGKTGRALVNVFLEDDRPVLETKRERRRFGLSPPSEACARRGHERLSCRSCHTAWAPQCVGCHTQRDEDGTWREFASDFFADPPTLGVREDAVTGASRIEPFAPGMIMTLNTHRRPVDGEGLMEEGTFHRLFAPAAPHTVAAEGRTCDSCHRDPLALGFGRGRLTLETSGAAASWRFDPAFAPLRDGLPADAWTPFLQTRTGPAATRLDARPFTRPEQQRILRVGACLTCHDPGSARGRRIFDDFPEALLRRHAVCRATPVDAAP